MSTDPPDSTDPTGAPPPGGPAPPDLDGAGGDAGAGDQGERAGPAPDPELDLLFDTDLDEAGEVLTAAAANLEAHRGRVLHERVESLDTQVRTLDERIDGLGGAVGDLRALHEALAATVSGDLPPGLGEFRTFATGELAELGAAVKELTAEAEKQKNPPVDWPSLTPEQAAVEWPVLARWVAEVLVPWYELTRAELPDCWALHRPVVMELSWLRSAHVQSYLAHSHPHIAGEWHTRWRATVLARIKDLITEQKCRPGEHMIAKEDSPSRRRPAPGDDPTPTPPQGTRRVPTLPPRYLLAERRHWWPFYARAFHADQAHRAAQARAASMNWIPEPPPPDPGPTSA